VKTDRPLYGIGANRGRSPSLGPPDTTVRPLIPAPFSFPQPISFTLIISVLYKLGQSCPPSRIPPLWPVARMASPSPTEKVDKSGEVVGMSVSSSSSIYCHALAEPLLIFSALVNRGLRYDLVGVGLEHFCHTRSKYLFAREASLNVLSSLLRLVGLLLSILRCPQFGVVIRLTRRLSLAPISGYTSFPFSYATLLKRLVRSSTLCGSSKAMSIAAEYVRFKGLLGRSEAYECFCLFEGD